MSNMIRHSHGPEEEIDPLALAQKDLPPMRAVSTWYCRRTAFRFTTPYQGAVENPT